MSDLCCARPAPIEWDENAPLLLRYGAIPHMWRWGLDFARNCQEDLFRRNAKANLRLALLSQKSLHEIGADVRVAYDRGTRGALKIYRDPSSLDAADHGSAILAHEGLQYRRVTPAECVALEPALAASQSTLAGGLYFETDEVGDPNKFTQGVAAWLADRGVRYRFRTLVRNLVRENGRIAAIETDGPVEADTVVVAMGGYTPLGQSGRSLADIPREGDLAHSIRRSLGRRT